MQNESGSALPLLIMLGIVVFMIVSMWKVFTKAGQPGWAVLVPFYNAYVFLTIAGKPGWWLVLLLIPLVNIVFSILALISFSQRFGKSGGFTAGLVLLPFVFYPVLAFDDSTYKA